MPLRLTVTTSDGVRLYAEATGSGLPVLFIHEFAADHRTWSRQVGALSGTFRCVTYSARGYPPSEVPPEQERYNYLRQADDAIDVLDAFGIAWAHVVGLSMAAEPSGAAAAALWLTLQLLLLTADGLGAVLRPGRRAALAWAGLIDAGDELTLFQRPQLDILSYFPTRRRLSEIDQASAHVLGAGLGQPAARSLFVATYTVDVASLAARGHRVAADVASGRILRSVLMKPETEEHVPALHQRVLDLLAGA